MAQRERAGLITPRSLDRNELPVFYIRRFTRTGHAVNTATTLHRHGAEAARGAHNSEGTGSKPVAGIFNSQFYRSCHAVDTAQQHTADVAQWKSA